MDTNNIIPKYNLLKVRINNLIEEWADAVALAQQYKDLYDQSLSKIEALEKELNEKKESLETSTNKTKVS